MHILLKYNNINNFLDSIFLENQNVYKNDLEIKYTKKLCLLKTDIYLEEVGVVYKSNKPSGSSTLIVFVV